MESQHTSQDSVQQLRKQPNHLKTSLSASVEANTKKHSMLEVAREDCFSKSWILS